MGISASPLQQSKRVRGEQYQTRHLQTRLLALPAMLRIQGRCLSRPDRSAHFRGVQLRPLLA